MKNWRIWIGLVFGVFVTLICLFARIFDPPILTTLRGSGFDTLQTIWPRSGEPPQPVRIVDIDEASLKTIGQWPWPRNELANLVSKLTELGASAIVFDIVFAEPDRLSPSSLAKSLNETTNIQSLPDNDQLLASAIAGGPVVTAFASTAGIQTNLPVSKASFAQTGLSTLDAPIRLAKIVSDIAILDEGASGIGSMNIDLAGDQGVARQIPLLRTDGKTFYPSLVLEALRVAQHVDTFVINGSADTENTIDSIRVGEIEIPTSEDALLQVNYRPSDAKLYVPAASFLRQPDFEALRPLIENHIVLIGTSAVGLLDMRTSALGEAIPGVSVHAQALEQILAGAYLSRPSWIVAAEYILTILLGVLLSTQAMFWRPWSTVGSMAISLIALATITTMAFRYYGVLFDFTFPAVALLLTFISTIAYRLLITDREGRQMRRVFGHYVAPSILAEIERNPHSLKLGGEIREVTVMFVDIQNFTPLSEKLPPQELVKIVNGVLGACSDAILAEGGTIDKYIGDAVMAFWNAPLAIPKHQYQAARAALQIPHRLTLFNDEAEVKSALQAIGCWPISVRTGMASGLACVGNMGSLERFDYSVIGEAVNTAARAENVCKQVGHDTVIAGEITDDTAQLACLYLGDVAMKGKSLRTPIYAILADNKTNNSKRFQSFKSDFEEISLRFAAGSASKVDDKNFIELSKTYPEYQRIVKTTFSNFHQSKRKLKPSRVRR
jgi:adenylate cyclase